MSLTRKTTLTIGTVDETGGLGWTRGSHRGGYEELYLLGHETMQSSERQLIHQFTQHYITADKNLLLDYKRCNNSEIKGK
jgi:hypothetical protein